MSDALAKSVCRGSKRNGEPCTREVAAGEKYCWQHARGIGRKWKSLTRNQSVIFVLAIAGLLLTLPGIYWHYYLPSRNKLHVTGYTMYQQTVGESLRLAVHLVNDGDATITTTGAYAIGVFDSKDRISLELEEKVFQRAEQEFGEKKKAGTLIVLEIPPGAPILAQHSSCGSIGGAS
jgi:hypothetical protein